jgi:flagellar export protein FliJ
VGDAVEGVELQLLPLKGMSDSPDSKDVKPGTRLDVVVKLREKDEDRAKKALAESERALRQAEAEHEQAIAATRVDLRVSGSAADWQLLDAAHGRALFEAAHAARAKVVAHQKHESSREQYASAYKRAETIRRVAETRRAEIAAEAEAKDRKELDELGVLLHLWT